MKTVCTKKKVYLKLIRAYFVIVYQQNKHKPFFKLLEWIYWKEVDSFYKDMGWSAWMLFPPSFYHYHTPEEIEQITKETKERVQKTIDSLSMKIFLDDTKLCPLGWVGVKTYKDFVDVVSRNARDIDTISLDYELNFTDKKHTGLDACNYLLQNPVNCKQIIIHSTHPKAKEMIDVLKGHYHTVMEKYDMLAVMKEYDEQKRKP